VEEEEEPVVAFLKKIDFFFHVTAQITVFSFRKFVYELILPPIFFNNVVIQHWIFGIFLRPHFQILECPVLLWRYKFLFLKLELLFSIVRYLADLANLNKFIIVENNESVQAW